MNEVTNDVHEINFQRDSANCMHCKKTEAMAGDFDRRISKI